jgi:hypothetical protein
MRQDNSFLVQHDSLGHFIVRIGLVVFLAMLLGPTTGLVFDDLWEQTQAEIIDKAGA